MTAIDKNTMQVLKVFDSQSEAAASLCISRKGITKACVGKTASYKGYLWRYADKDYDRPVNPGAGNYAHDKLLKPIVMTEHDGTEHNYESVKAAAAALGMRSSTISRYLLGLRNDSRGRRWCYATFSKAE